MQKGMISVIACDNCAMQADMIEAVLSVEQMDEYLAVDKNSIHYIHDMIEDKTKIKSYIMTITGSIYPSTFNVSTLVKRIDEALGNESEERYGDV